MNRGLMGTDNGGIDCGKRVRMEQERATVEKGVTTVTEQQ